MRQNEENNLLRRDSIVFCDSPAFPRQPLWIWQCMVRATPRDRTQLAFLLTTRTIPSASTMVSWLTHLHQRRRNSSSNRQLSTFPEGPADDKGLRDPPPLPPKRSLVECFDALALQTSEKDGTRFPKSSSFVGGFDPALLSANVVRPSAVPPRTPDGKVFSTIPRVPLDMAPPSKQAHVSLTMQHAMRMANHPLPHSTPVTHPQPAVLPKSNTTSSPQSSPPSNTASAKSPSATSVVTPLSSRTKSSPASVNVSSTSKTRVQCTAMTKAGNQCSRWVLLSPVTTLLDPTPAVYCHQHRQGPHQDGFYARQAGQEDKYVEFKGTFTRFKLQERSNVALEYIPEYLHPDTQLALRAEMEKTPSSADVPGYIYTFEIRGIFSVLGQFVVGANVSLVDQTNQALICFKVGRAVNLNKRLDQWDKQCGSKVQIVRGWWPTTRSNSDDGTHGSLLKNHITPGQPGPLCHRVERLIHLELADLAHYAPYLQTGWPGITNPSKLPSSRSPPTVLSPCPDCKDFLSILCLED